VADYYDPVNMRWVKGAEDSTAIPKIERAPPPRPVCANDKELREKALMYAVQAHAADPRMFITGNADAFLKFLKGEAA